MVDAEGRHGSIVCPGGPVPQAEAQSLVGVWREGEELHIQLPRLLRILNIDQIFSTDPKSTAILTQNTAPKQQR